MGPDHFIDCVLDLWLTMSGSVFEFGFYDSESDTTAAIIMAQSSRVVTGVLFLGIKFDSDRQINKTTGHRLLSAKVQMNGVVPLPVELSNEFH